MNHPEQTPKKPTATTGLFALLRGLLGVGGTRASKIIQGTTASKTSRRLILSVLATTLGVLAFTAAPALASGGHEFKESFNGGVGHEFNDPTGVAVNSVTGDVYVVDKGNNRVEEFNSEGGFVAEFKGSGAGTLSEPEAIAIDNSDEPVSLDPSVGDAYVTDHNVVDKFDADGTYLGQITGTCAKGGEIPPSCSKSTFVAFEPLDGVAVDPKGQVWVYQENKQIDAFSDAASNAFLSSGESEAGGAQPGLAVDSEDDLYVVHGGLLTVAKLNSKGEVIKGGEQDGNTGVAVDPSSNDLYTDIGNAIQVYTSEEFVKRESPETFGEAQLTDGGGTGLAVSYAPISGGDVYVVDSSANKVNIFIPAKATGYAESFHFGGEGTGSGQFAEPLGVAVNDVTKDLYVVDKGNKRVEEFNSTGTKVEAEFAPPGGFTDPEAIAVDNSGSALDPSNENVYVTDGGVVDKFSASGTYVGRLTGFPPNDGVAVSPEGNVWVGSGESLIEFSDTGTFERSEVVRISNPSDTYALNYVVSGLAVGSGEIGYVLTRLGVVKFNFSSGKALGYEHDAFAGGALALDPSTGDLFVDRGSSIERYAPVKDEEYPSPLETFTSTGLPLQESQGIAVSPAGTVYATERTADDVKAFTGQPLAQVAVGAVANLRRTSVTLEGSVDPEGKQVSSCVFEYGTTTAYGQTAPCETEPGKPLGEGTKPVLVHAKLSGLAPDTTYHYRLVAIDAIGTNRSSDHEVTTLGPSITAEQVTYVEAERATLNAQIGPNGSATSYHFEYDTTPYGEGEAAHGTSLPVPSAAIGAGTSPVSVSVKLTGLKAGTTYYYRAVAEGAPLGAPESFYGPGKTFTTNPGTEPPQNCPNEQRRIEQPYGLKLPDCRAYEMASPLNTEGQDATDRGELSAPRASVSGDAVTYASQGNFAEPTGSALENQFISRRNAEKGRWETQSITPPADPTETSLVYPYAAIAFTPELTEGIAENDGFAESEATVEPEWFSLYVDSFASDSYRYIGSDKSTGEDFFPAGTSTDLSHVLYGEETADYFEWPQVKEWVNGKTTSVNVGNYGESIDAQESTNLWHLMSADGLRAYWSSLDARVLYLRENGEQPQSPMSGGVCTDPSDACTIAVSASQKTDGTGPNGTDPNEQGGSQPSPFYSLGTVFDGASADGSKVFFTTHQELTNDANTGVSDKQEVLLENASSGTYTLTFKGQTTAPLAYNAGHEEVQSALEALSSIGAGNVTVSGSVVTFDGVLAGSEQPPMTLDGSSLNAGANAGIHVLPHPYEDLYQYDVETGKLTDLSADATDATAIDGAGVLGVATISEDGAYVYFVAEGDLATGAVAGQPNLYVSHEGGAPTFIATLAAGEDYSAGPETNPAVVNPSGTRLAFTSSRELTGYDNHDANTGEPDAEIYLYDAETGGLVCASCNPSGARPVAGSNFSSDNDSEKWAVYRQRNLLENGTLFFDSSDALVPHTSDGRENVYEYEDGHVYAISDVAGGYESFFMDASANGENVFFETADQLLPEDTSNNLEVWDARVDGGFPVSVAPPPCNNGDACKPPETPQPGVLGAPSSSTFSGPGNIPTPRPPAVVKPKSKPLTRAQKLAKALKVCAKGKQKSKRARCQKQAKQKYGPTRKKAKAKKSSNDRRTKS